MEKQRILLATQNEGKILEMKALLSDLDVTIVGTKNIPDYGSVEETGSTFLENALIKARYGRDRSGLITVADDSGLMVDALHGEPGIFSARYGGENTTDELNNQKLLKELENVDYSHRQGRYICAIAIATPWGEEFTAEGVLEGRILKNPAGSGGFGYDPLFFVEDYKKTVAELPLEVKNEISHRAKALEQAAPILKTILEEGSICKF